MGYQDMLTVARSRWRLGAGAFLLFMSLGVVAAILQKPVYRATVVVVPAGGGDESGALSALAGQVSGIASLVGLSGVGGRQNGMITAVLKSRSLFSEYAKKTDLMPVLFSQEWDSAQRRWRQGIPASRVPSDDDAWEMFDSRIRRVSQDQKTGIVRFEIFWRDRVLAAKWANDLVALADDTLRNQALLDADTELVALKEELERTDATELRQAIHRLGEAQLRKKILAKSRPTFALEVLDAARVPDEDRFDTPKRVLDIILSAIVGLFAALIIVAWPVIRRKA